MNNIFEKIRPFEFIAEAEKNANAAQPQNNNFIYVKLNGNRFDELELAMRGYDAIEVSKFPANNNENKYVIMLDETSNDEAIRKWLDQREENGELEELTMDAQTHAALYQYYSEKIKKDFNDISEQVKSNPKPDTRVSRATKGKINAFIRMVKTMEPALTKSNDVEKRKQQRKKIEAYKNSAMELKNAVEEASDENLNNVRRLIDTINYEDRELAIKKLSDAMLAIKTMKAHGEIAPVNEGALMKKIDAARKRLGIDADKFEQVMQSGAGEALAAFVMSFIYTEQKDENQIADEYSAVMEAIETQKDSLEPETYKNLKQIMENEMTTKVAILKALEERENMPVRGDGEKTEGGEKQQVGDVEIAATKAAGNVYVIKAQLQLGQTVTVSNLENIKGEDSGRKDRTLKKDNMREILKGAILARTEVSLFNLMGYEPKGAAAYAVQSYDPLRKHVGEVMQVASRDTAGLLLSVFGKNGRELGEGFGRVLKHELIGNPLEVNPALAQGEMWLRNKFNLFPKKPEGDIRKAARMVEDAAAGVAPGGDGMNVPGMIGGMGDPVAPTKDTTGSGDNFNPRVGKKKKKNDVVVLDFYSFRDSLNVNK